MGALRVRCPSQDKPVAAIHSVVSWRQSRLSLSLSPLVPSPATTSSPKKGCERTKKAGPWRPRCVLCLHVVIEIIYIVLRGENETMGRRNLLKWISSVFKLKKKTRSWAFTFFVRTDVWWRATEDLPRLLRQENNFKLILKINRYFYGNNENDCFHSSSFYVNYLYLTALIFLHCGTVL